MFVPGLRIIICKFLIWFVKLKIILWRNKTFFKGFKVVLVNSLNLIPFFAFFTPFCCNYAWTYHNALLKSDLQRGKENALNGADLFSKKPPLATEKGNNQKLSVRGSCNTAVRYYLHRNE